ncbi:MAG: carboxypeptidase-like regulatory domain-containing protein [Acidobacteriia bacterium]|nr:carboxypeptidase-like regulatory domain-containing protein [Terriglobia bacterium]
MSSDEKISNQIPFCARGGTALLSLSVARAQVTTTGEIHGTVLDPTGAVVPTAVIKLEDEATGIARETTSVKDGGFVFVTLPAGSYRLSATAKGFRTALYTGVIVETARTRDIIVQMTIGEASTTVEVSGAATPLETSSNEVSTTVQNRLVQDLPLSGRDLLGFGLLMAGAQRGASERNSTYNGLPNASLNITLDGVNDNSQRFKSGGTSNFVFAPLRLGAIDEVTVSTNGLSADASGEGAMQLRFVTKRGTNQFHGGAFEQFRNDALNANTWVNDASGLPTPRLRQNEFGGNLGGPLWKNKLFFFANYEENRAPSQSLATNLILTSEAQQGIFRYSGTDGQQHTVDLLQIAGAAGFPNKVDPTITGLLSRMNGALSAANLAPNDLITNQLRWNLAGGPTERYPTARMDYQATSKLSVTGTWNLRWRDIRGTQPWPGSGFKPQSEFKSTYYVASIGVNYAVTPTIFNEVKFGVQSNVEQFNVGENPSQYALNGTLMKINFPLGIPAIIRNGNNGAEPRNNPVYNLYDTLRWLRGSHTFVAGFSLLRTTMWDSLFGNAGVPNLTVGVDPSDPISSVIAASTVPGVRSSDLPSALALYAMLTGRVSGIASDRAVDENSHQYNNYTPLVSREAQQSVGIYFQDSWRVRPTLTLNYGMRWEFSGDIHNTNGTYNSPTLADIYGPSSQLFAPGQLNGVANPTLSLRPHTYASDNVNPAPNFGFAWSPSAEGGFLGKLLGKDRKTVIRGNYGITYYQEGMLTFGETVGANPGGTQALFLNPGQPGFAAGSLSVSTPLPPLQTFPTSFAPPFQQSLFTFGGLSFGTTSPNLRTPYVQNWSLGVQRDLDKNLVLEVRYVGNKATHIWRTYNTNEVNTLENGFAREFANAQKNLAINQSAGVNSFANLGRAGQVPLPIFETAFGASAGQPALANGSGFGNGTFITQLGQGLAGATAANLATSPTYFCRLVGAALPACASSGYTGSGTFPINFFQANRFNSGATLNATGIGSAYDLDLVTDDGNSTYNGLQIELRRRFSNGLNVTTNYTYAKALGDLFGENEAGFANYTTLRNRGLNKGPSVFDIRQAWQTYLNYELPFGRGHAIVGNGVVNRIIGGWTLGSIIRVQSGRPFKLVSNRGTVNQYDSGVILNGLTTSQLQNMLTIRSGPSHNISFVSPALVGADGRANTAVLAPAATPGQFGQFIFLYGPKYVQADMSLIKDIPIREPVKMRLAVEALNAFNHPVFQAGGDGARINITSTTFGQTTATAVGPRNLQLRLQIWF